jgi:hypothetical protein
MFQMIRPSFILAFLVFGVVGCSEGLESEVTGIVTLDGKTIGPGTVNFSPVDGKSNPAVGTIKPNGTYFLKTSREDGLRAGNYSVAVSVFEQSATPTGERSMAPPKLLTPEKYNTIETSGLEFEVKPGDNTIDIDLKSK